MKFMNTQELLDKLVQIQTKEEAQQFLNLYEKENPHARINIGYAAGYLSKEQREKVYNLFGVDHPFLREDMSFEEIIAVGKKLAEDTKKYGAKEAMRINTINRGKIKWRSIEAPFEPQRP